MAAGRYAASRGYSKGTLLRWSAELRRVEQVDEIQFVRVALERAELAPTAVVVEVGAARVRVERGFDPALLRDIVRALSGEGVR